MSEQPKLGQILAGEQFRDAIHIAIAPVIAAHILTPGEHVGLIGDEDEPLKVGRVANVLGIVDPYLKTRVMPGEQFFLFLYPQTITSLRHEWTHPAFSGAPTVAAPVVTKSLETHKAQSESWLKAQAERIDIGVRSLMDAAQTWLQEDQVTVQHGSTSWRDDFGDPAEFWHHYEIVTGTVVPENRKRSFFCCSC